MGRDSLGAAMVSGLIRVPDSSCPKQLLGFSQSQGIARFDEAPVGTHERSVVQPLSIYLFRRLTTTFSLRPEERG